MAIYSLANRTTGASSGTPALELITSSTDRPRLIELGFFVATATASAYAMGRPAAIGVTPTSPITLLAENPSDPAGKCQTALAWATPPTAPTTYMRRHYLAASAGLGITWFFPYGIVIAVSSSIVLWNLQANSVADCHVVVDE